MPVVARRRGGDVAARGTHVAGGDAGRRLPLHHIALTQELMPIIRASLRVIGEAETGAAEAPRGRGIGLAEFLEPQALNFVGGTSDFRSGRSGWYGMEPGKWALEALAAVESETRHLVHTEAA
jgi:hypothetical protein